MVLATLAFGNVATLLMLVLSLVIDEFRIVGDDELLNTPWLRVPPVAVAVTCRTRTLLPSLTTSWNAPTKTGHIRIVTKPSRVAAPG